MDASASIPDSVGDCVPRLDLSAHFWRRVFDASHDAQLVCRLDGTIAYANTRAFHLLKILDLNAPRRLSEFLGEPFDERVAESLQRRGRQSEVFHSVPISVGSSGAGSIDLELLPLDHGHVLVVFKDASRRLRMESHVRRLVTAIDATPEVFFITDSACNISFVNPAFQMHTGYSIHEALGRDDSFLRAPDQKNRVQTYRAAVQEGREWTGVLTNVRRDGTVYQVEATLSPILDNAGSFIGYVACEHDITERLRLEREVRLESDYIHSILTSLDSAIYTVDRDLRLTHANEGWRHMPVEHGGIRLGGAPEVGRPLLDYVPSRERRTELERLFNTVLVSRYPEEHQYADRDERRWLLKISPLIHADEVRGLICSVSDQTQFHQLQTQLFQSQKMEIIGTLAAGVAHDFNNLLQAIRGNVSLLLLQLHEIPELHHCARQISVAASRATEITQQLLTFSRTGEEKDSVVDLNDVIHEAAQLARRTLRGNIALELVPAPDPVPVRVDPTRANQVLLNLCVNAQDAMPEGGRLTITNTAVRLPGDLARKYDLKMDAPFVCCNVSDTGCGISPDLIGRIFEPFFTTKEKGKGTGLGLPIVQRLLEEAGGCVEVDTVVGHGTTFHLYFPLVEGGVVNAPDEQAKELVRGSGRVLVVDDLDLLRDFTRSFLEASGFTVLIASSGQEAIKVLEEAAEPVDLLFTDYSMPGMNGIELIERVAVRWPDMKMILASGYLDDNARSKLDALKVNFLCKPYEMQDAAELMMQLLSE